MKFNIKKLSKKQILLLCLFALAVAIFIFAFVKLFPLMKSHEQEETKREFDRWVSSLRGWGIIAVIGCQVAQIILFFIPGEIFEFTSGLLYGAFQGYMIVLIGQIVSIVLVYCIFWIFGNKFANALIGEETMNKIKKNETRSEVILFFCLLLPGIPKDIFYYGAPSCKIPLWKFIIISSIARIPSSLPSVLAGASIGEGKIGQSAIVIVISAVIAISGIIFNKQIVKFIEGLKHRGNKNTEKETIKDVQE